MDKKTYISLFSSAGIGCYGFKMQGFECIATNELLQKRLAIQKANKKCKYESGYIAGDILQNTTKESIYTEIAKWKEIESLKEVTAIIATPPCQGMSVANHKKKDESKRNSLVVESLILIKSIKPRFFVLENVRAFLGTTCTDIDGEIKPIKQAIFDNLGAEYEIESQILNFKDYGSNSSRTRTVVLGVKKDLNISPIKLFPNEQKAKTLFEVIGKFPRLKKMGEIDRRDIYHYFRKYTPEMRRWLEFVKEGESAFDNRDESRLPHYYKNGEKVFSKNGNGDKYTRQCWDKVAPCIHTRNDILASQNTVHPEDDRVFSISELMQLMSIPSSFKWVEKDIKELNSMSIDDKEKFLKSNDINIRQSIGEAVPTEIFRQIAENIAKAMNDDK